MLMLEQAETSFNKIISVLSAYVDFGLREDKIWKTLKLRTVQIRLLL